MSILRRLTSIRLAVAASAGVALVACGHETPITELRQVVLQSKVESGINLNFCLDPAFEPKQVIKTVIVLDHSGSNQQNYQVDASGNMVIGPGGAVNISTAFGTDPLGVLRYGDDATQGTLLNYLRTLPANDPLDPTKYFALVNFSSGASTYPTNATGFTADIADFYAKVKADAQPAPSDSGATSYLSALDQTYKIITADLAREKNCANLPITNAPTAACPRPGRPTSSNYVVIFMSDGAPITQISGIGTANVQVTRESAVQIMGQVGSIQAISTDAKFVTGVNLFTIYYYKPGNVDPAGQALLGNMASAGNGIAYVAQSGSRIDYTQFQPAKKRVRFSLGDVFVTNASMVWWTDGKIHPDTDRDGLPDDVEATFGTNPRARASFGGVSDLVRYQLGGVVDMAKCSGIPANRRSDPNGLTDCEKALLGNVEGIGLPDSNSDLIPDFLEFKNFLPFQYSTAPAVNDVSLDGYTPYQKVKLSLPVVASLDQLLQTTPTQYSMSLVSSDASRDCYAVNVRGMPVVALADGSSNVIRVDVIEKAELLRDQYRYYVAEKAFAPGALQLRIDDWSNPGEIAAGIWKSWQ